MSAPSSQRFPHHRAQRRDAGAAGDEQQMPLGEVIRQAERAQSALRFAERSRHRAFEVRIGRLVIVDLDEQFERARGCVRSWASRQSSTGAARSLGQPGVDRLARGE